jgi:hypothetical protein
MRGQATKLFRFNGGRIGITVDSTWYDIKQALGLGLQSWPQFPAVLSIAEVD